MTGVLLWKLRRSLRKVWVRISLYGATGVLTALAGAAIAGLMPMSSAPFGINVSQDALESLLNILTSSMLAVTTFSLSIMAAAFASASSSATPRAFRLLKEDMTAQHVLATFMGSFVFGLVGIIALKLGLYGAQGRVVLFVATVFVFGLIVMNLVRWMNHLTDFGRMVDTLRRLEEAAVEAVVARLDTPFLGGRPFHDTARPDGLAVYDGSAGSVQYIDMKKLSAVADRCDVQVVVAALPGAFVDPSQPLAYITGPNAEEAANAVRKSFVVDDHRSFEQDPRFGLCALSEVASRALSPAVNDPGTAIDVIGRVTRVLLAWAPTGLPKVDFPRVWVPPLDAMDMVEDAFAPIARDGAALIEVQLRLQEGLRALVTQAPDLYASAARAQSALSLAHSRATMTVGTDIEQVEAVAKMVAAACDMAQS